MRGNYIEQEKKGEKKSDTPARSVRVVHKAAAIITHSSLFINQFSRNRAGSRCPRLARTDEPEYEIADESKTAR